MDKTAETNSAISFEDVEAYGLSPNEYCGLIITINLNNITELSAELNEWITLDNYPRTCVITVGSDGKKERHTQQLLNS